MSEEISLEDLIREYLNELEGSKTNIRFQRLVTICENVFGDYRTKGSHHIFKTPWPGDPRINIQDAGGGEAKSYQVRQVKRSLSKRLEQLSE